MKSARLSWGIPLSLLIFSCQNGGATHQKTPFQPAVSEPKADHIVRDTVTSKDGLQLVMAFNNTQQTARFILHGEIIDLKQNPLASGIKYSNLEYEFTDHQGQMTLKKSGKTVFSYNR